MTDQGRAEREEKRRRQKMREKAEKLINPKPVELPSGKWRCQLMVKGKRISITNDDPEIAHAQVNAIKLGLIKEKKSFSDMTVGEAMDRYIASKDGILSPTTIKTYKKIRNNHLKSIISTPLHELTQEAVQKSVNTMSKKNAPKTVHSTHGFLSAVLNTYCPDFVLHTTLPQKRPHEASIPDTNEIKIILNQTAGTKMELPILLSVWLGLRESEIRGLTWNAIDGDFIHITQAIVDGENGPAVKGAKSFSGYRTIRLPDHIKKVLERQPRTDEYIVHLSGQAMYKRFVRICEKLGLPHYRFHDLRHTAASVAMSLGVPNTYNQKRMGHKTDHMLKTVYLHTMKSKEDVFANMIDSTFDEILHTELHTKEDNT